MIGKIWIIIFTAIPFLSMGQKSISDWIELKDFKHKEIKSINLYVMKKDKKILVEKIDFNNKCLILNKVKYCNFLYDPLDSIEREIYEYDNSDTLLISRRYENENGDTLGLFKYTYEYDSIGRLLSKGTEDITFNEYELEQYFYNGFGLMNKWRINFYNDTRDSISYFIDWDYSYDKFGNKVKESSATEGNPDFERIYIFDSLNNLTSYETKGIHQCGYDIDRYKITYNSQSKNILKEIWNASGENWAFGYAYDESGKLIKKVKKSRYLKRKYKGLEIPMYTQNMLEKKYTDVCVYKFSYDSKALLIRVSEIFIKYNLKTDYIIEYE